MSTPPPDPPPTRKPRVNREFRILFRPTGPNLGSTVAKKASPPRRKLSRVLGFGSSTPSMVDSLAARLAEKTGHWAVVVLAPSEPPVVDPKAEKKKLPRSPINADDPRIERVFEICHPERPVRDGDVGGATAEEKPVVEMIEDAGAVAGAMAGADGGSDDDDDFEDFKKLIAESTVMAEPTLTTASTLTVESTLTFESTVTLVEQKERKWGWKAEAKCGLNVKCKMERQEEPVAPRREPRPPTPDDSGEEDRYEDDEGFRGPNAKGRALKMQVSKKPRPDFTELKYKHVGGTIWEILTGIEARTKFSNSELRHEATRIWNRQQNYHTLDNNCQRFCILLAITIRAKNHSLLRVLHGQIVEKQTGMISKLQSLKK